ncbi:host attachment protein [Pseudorhodobacter sp. MZDSW-24AT]|uniref:baeRF12 domain-containing protein n=1 Tax=Pseudorhodobacter sp. MZDSW-24AT TaxID=2052957 RepID=UPI000C1F87C4|nr:host attachment protein [Pseudorhodobacter sp. MZDSW-24AT]PJF10721.1 hypothetical protein CUR21_01810 [Pseudorhodobacter sp. MZDSW-24AT]
MTTMTRNCWLVVVDGDGAMILENAGTVTAPDLRVIDRIATPGAMGAADRWPAREEASDRARLAETAMVAMLMTRLAFAVRQSRMSRLAIAAPPHLLEAIRTRLDDNLRSRVVIMLPKTLTHHPLEQVVAVINEAMLRAA